MVWVVSESLEEFHADRGDSKYVSQVEILLLCLRDSKGVGATEEDEQVGLVGFESMEEGELDQVGFRRLGEDLYCMRWELWEGYEQGSNMI